ncbi:MAG: ABC transporter substrate-binding protein [Allorhizobium sp.]
MHNLSRRQTLGLGAATFLTGILAGRLPVLAADASTLTIAYNVNLPSFDPTVGPSAVNPSIQAIYRSIFDQFIGQGPDLSFQPGLLTAWGWNDDRTKVWMNVREDVTWHDGSKFTPEDVVWSLERAAKAETGNPIQFVWSTAGNYTIEGNKITGDVLRFEPTFFKWMAFLTGYILPKAYYEKVGAEGFEKKPIGTGPYMVDAYEGNAFLRLKANPAYFGGKPAFETVIFKFVPDGTSRVAEIESGSSDITLEIPYEEFDRLKGKAGLAGVATPISDIGMIFLNNIDAMLDKNVRLAAHHAIDKKAIVERLLHGYGVPIDTLEAPEYDAYDPSIVVGYDPEKSKTLLAASGFSTDKPVKFTIQTTRGFKPKDYEMIQAIVGMWRKVGIEAEIEVYEIAKHYELRAADNLAPAAFYNWGNAIGDPTTSTGFAMFGPSPHSVWNTDDLDAMIGPLWGEKDEAKRIAGWKAVSKYIAEEGYVIPLLQYAQPIVYKDTLKVVPNVSGALQPTLVSKA